jgi:hypothetical protein
MVLVLCNGYECVNRLFSLASASSPSTKEAHLTDRSPNPANRMAAKIDQVQLDGHISTPNNPTYIEEARHCDFAASSCAPQWRSQVRGYDHNHLCRICQVRSQGSPGNPAEEETSLSL